jgi:hypothetical protein
MRFLLADSFTTALARLPAAEAKAAKTTVVDLQIDPTGKELVVSPHRQVSRCRGFAATGS